MEGRRCSTRSIKVGSMEIEPELLNLGILHQDRLRRWDEDSGLLISWLLVSICFVCSKIFPTSMLNRGFPPLRSIALHSSLAWCIYFHMLHTSLGNSMYRKRGTPCRGSTSRYKSLLKLFSTLEEGYEPEVSMSICVLIEY